MEIQMPQGVDMIDLKAAHFQPFQTVSCGQGSGACTFGITLAKHPFGLEVTAHIGVRRYRSVGSFETDTQVVKM